MKFMMIYLRNIRKMQVCFAIFHQIDLYKLPKNPSHIFKEKSKILTHPHTTNTLTPTNTLLEIKFLILIGYSQLYSYQLIQSLEKFSLTCDI